MDKGRYPLLTLAPTLYLGPCNIPEILRSVDLEPLLRLLLVNF